jgi:Predicted metal-dependent hydrolase
MQKTIEDPHFGTVTLKKSTRSRRITLRVDSCGNVVLTMPYPVPYSFALDFLDSKRDWVAAARERVRSRIGSDLQPSAEAIEALRARAKEELPRRLQELADEYSFKVNSVRIKHNSSNWGSCSRKGNINLNLNLVRVPEDLRDYVILHELCHLRHPDHGPEFHSLLESMCPGHRQKERELRKHRLI